MMQPLAKLCCSCVYVTHVCLAASSTKLSRRWILALTCPNIMHVHTTLPFTNSSQQNRHCSLLSQPVTGCRFWFWTLCHVFQSHTETITVFPNKPTFKYVNRNSTAFVYILSKEWHLGGSDHLVPYCRWAQGATQCTVNPGNGDHLSVRKIVKKQSQYSAEILQSNSVKRQTCKILSASMCFCRASSRLGNVGTKGWFSQTTVVGAATFHICP